MMDLLEKVTKGLVVCREMNNPPGWRCTDCVECPYHENGCAKKLKEDAIELLKEQQEVREHLSKGIGRLNKLLDKKNSEIERLKAEMPVHCKVCNFMKNGADADCMVCGNPKSRCYEYEVNGNDYCPEGKEG